MNYLQRKTDKNLRRFLETDIESAYAIPNKRNTLYKRKDGRLITHRALIKTIKLIMKNKQKENLKKI